jgi:cell division protein FtsL
MLKLTICLVFAMALAVMMLHLRQQRLELNHQANRLHNQIENQQAKLWSQQLDIAVYTAPNAIAKTIGEQPFDLMPQSPMRVGTSNWMDVRGGGHGRATD